MTDTDIKELVERMRQALLNIIKQDQKVTGTTSEDAWEHDGPFATIARAALEQNTILASEVERMRGALEEIAKPTYGTDFCNTQEENNAILAPHVFWYQNIARAALGKDTPDGK